MERGGIDILPPTLEEAVATDAVKIRSTGTRRTVQSAQAMVQGLYGVRNATPPGSGVAPSSALRIEVRDRMDESMFPNPGMMSCKRQIELMKSLDGDEVVGAAEQAAWSRKTLAAVRDRVHARNVDKRRRQREEALRELRAIKEGATPVVTSAGESLGVTSTAVTSTGGRVHGGRHAGGARPDVRGERASSRPTWRGIPARRRARPCGSRSRLGRTTGSSCRRA